MKISFDGNQITLGATKVDLEARIEEADQHDDLVLVRLSYDDYADDDPNGERNVIALDADGKLVWRIDRTPAAMVRDGKRVTTSYVGIDPSSKRNGRPVEAYDSSGGCWRLNPKTGEVSDPIVTK